MSASTRRNVAAIAATRLTSEEFSHLHRHACDAELSISAYLRRLVLADIEVKNAWIEEL